MKTPTLILSVCLSILAACSKSEAPAAAPAKPAATAGADHEHGEEKPIGPMTIGAYQFQVVQLGDVKAGAEAVFELEFAKDAKIPPIVRAWLGVASGEGSRKARFGKEGDHGLHAHVQAPDALGADARLWIEVETDGATERAATAWK